MVKIKASSGEKRHRITIVRQTGTLDEFGQEIFVSSDVGKAWSSFAPMKGLEKRIDDSVVVEASHVFCFCNTGLNLTEKDLISYNGKTYEISWIRDPMIIHSDVSVFAKEYKGNKV